jgi:hypothetical protein
MRQWIDIVNEGILREDFRVEGELFEAIDYSEYGYWVKPDGEAFVVPNSRHYQTLLHNYSGPATYSHDRYGNVISEGWVWVFVSGTFICFLDPHAITTRAAATLVRIVNLYADSHQYRFVLTNPGEDVGREKHDFDRAAEARNYIRTLVGDSSSGMT